MSKVSISNLAAEIVLAVEQYTEAVSAAIEAEIKQTADAVLKEIKDRSPVDTGEYKKGWKVKRSVSESDRVRYIIYQKSKPQLSHLLEFGHAKAGGGRVDPSPRGGHILPAYKAHVPAMQERIKKIIEGGGEV